MALGKFGLGKYGSGQIWPGQTWVWANLASGKFGSGQTWAGAKVAGQTWSGKIWFGQTWDVIENLHAQLLNNKHLFLVTNHFLSEKVFFFIVVCQFEKPK